MSARAIPRSAGPSRRRRRPPLALAAVALLLVAAVAPSVASAAAPSPRVRGNQLVDGRGHPLRLLGVNQSGAEYACVQGWGFFDGPTDAAAVRAIRSWGVDTVRLPLNEDCWLGLNGVSAAYGGRRYRDEIARYVARLTRAGLVVLLDLHWNAPGGARADGQQPMADRDHAPAFWRSVAGTFRRNRAVLFDLYNEPHDIGWGCWRDGCRTGERWRTAGMQALVDAVRGAGARQPVVVSGLAYANDLSAWRAYRPRDPARQLVAAVHVYNFNTCADADCWDRTVAPVARSVPVVAAEIGEDDCAHGFIDGFMDWADRHGVSYLGWTWDTWDCASGPALIQSSDGTPTEFGRGFRDHLAAVAGR